MIYLGIDWGEKRIGLALGGDELGLATPYGVVSSLAEIKTVVAAEAIDVIVVGQPIKMSGQSHDLTAGFAEFVTALETETALPVRLIDERLTSRAADTLARSKSKKILTKKIRKTSAARDSVAAMLILQSYLDLHTS